MGAPSKPSLAIPAYDGALDTLKTSIVEGMVGIDPLLGQIASRTTGHAGPVRNVPGPNPVDHERTHFEGGYAIHVDAIRETDVDAFITAIYGVAEQYVADMGATFFEPHGTSPTRPAMRSMRGALAIVGPYPGCV